MDTEEMKKQAAEAADSVKETAEGLKDKAESVLNDISQNETVKAVREKVEELVSEENLKAVQEKVMNTIQSTTGFEQAEVNVHVSGIAFEK